MTFSMVLQKVLVAISNRLASSTIHGQTNKLMSKDVPKTELKGMRLEISINRKTIHTAFAIKCSSKKN